MELTGPVSVQDFAHGSEPDLGKYTLTIQSFMRILVTGGSGFIGTNFVTRAIQEGHTVKDLSHTPPLSEAHREIWTQQNILEREGLIQNVQRFAPECVVHLAARAECDENTTVEAGYQANTLGTKNLLDAVRQTPSVQRLIVTSTQYVCGPGRLPKSDEDYFPATIYGESKVETERMTRSAGLDLCWTITRPTNVWGPWHLRYQREFWRIAASGLYVHPTTEPIIRSYGYVGNVVDQMLNILTADRSQVHGRTFYLGDEPSDIYEWTNAFCLALRNRPARRIPFGILRAAAKLGDGISAISRRPFYIQSSRLRSMTTPYDTPMDPTFQVLGRGPFDLRQGVSETVAWLNASRSSNSSA